MLARPDDPESVSVLFNEPKLLKTPIPPVDRRDVASFSALQRAEIAENSIWRISFRPRGRFSALQRAEIAEKPTRSGGRG